MSEPRVAGVSSGKTMLLLGRLPSKTLLFTSASLAPGPTSYGIQRTSAPLEKHTKPLRDETEGEAHLADLLLGLAERERLGLREVVAEQDAVVQGAAERIVRRRRGKEVRRDELRTLVQQLVERVLPVRAGRAPNNWLRHAQ